MNAYNIIIFYSCIVTFLKDIYFISNGAPHRRLWYANGYDTVDHIITLKSDVAYIKVLENANILFELNSIRYQVIRVIL